ncbi:VOC family protein [Kitasatospora sp. NBC_01287]|uniref:VOC family protein n=1 Tax=Kitasatospora sp. NBC_01287 TaxID=2903573 RepID=UPI002259495F|nr:VOC family protein [Kitasatospora sp. NBC_01287]MCX4750180.1 VOC family protein [Kitasatospora sp. NBC_01287]
MTILKTYARLWTDELDHSLALLRELTGAEPDLRFVFGSIQLAAIGDFLVIAGPPAERARFSHASATVIVDDLDALTSTLAAAGAEITAPVSTGVTGRFLYARHRGGAEVEYVEWIPELVERVMGAGISR